MICWYRVNITPPSKLREIDLFTTEYYGVTLDTLFVIKHQIWVVCGVLVVACVLIIISLQAFVEEMGTWQALRLRLADCHSEVQTHSLRTNNSAFIPPKAKFRSYDFPLPESFRLPLTFLSPPAHRPHPPSSKCVPLFGSALLFSTAFFNLRPGLTTITGTGECNRQYLYLLIKNNWISSYQTKLGDI